MVACRELDQQRHLPRSLDRQSHLFSCHSSCRMSLFPFFNQTHHCVNVDISLHRDQNLCFSKRVAWPTPEKGGMRNISCSSSQDVASKKGPIVFAMICQFGYENGAGNSRCIPNDIGPPVSKATVASRNAALKTKGARTRPWPSKQALSLQGQVLEYTCRFLNVSIEIFERSAGGDGCLDEGAIDRSRQWIRFHELVPRYLF